MRFKTPFYAVMKAVNRALQENESGTEWFDGSAEIPEIELLFCTAPDAEMPVGVIHVRDSAVIGRNDRITVFEDFKHHFEIITGNLFKGNGKIGRFADGKRIIERHVTERLPIIHTAHLVKRGDAF